MKRTNVTAIVPMRHDSVRVPGKNYRDFAGKPLFYRIIDTLLQATEVDQVVIDTDSPEIAASAAKHFTNVILIERPLHLREGEVPMNDVLLHTISQVPSDFYLQTHSTNPLLRAVSVDRAVGQFKRQYPMYDTLFSVTRKQVRLWDQLTRPVNHNANILLRTQDLPPVYEENSCLYLFTQETLEEQHNRIGRRPLMFEIDAREAMDIDEEIDFEMAEFLFEKSQQSTVDGP